MDDTSKSSKILRCYNCGRILTKDNCTREHIPAQALYDGYENSFKKDRITVPACLECNNKYSITDEEFRNIIGACSNIVENSAITGKAVKSIVRKKNPVKFLGDGSIGVEFKEHFLNDFHKKNFKGLFYYQYGKVLPKRFELFVNVDENDWSDLTQGIITYLKAGFEWKYSGHPDIFSYCLQPFRTNLVFDTSNKKQDLVPSESDNIFVCAMKYNRTHAALVYAINTENKEL